jgi:hypothetical protein
MSKARNAAIVGQTMNHIDFGAVQVLRAVPGSFTKVEIKVIQRKRGWFDAGQYYRPVMRTRPNPKAGPGAVTVYFDTARRDEYGHLDVAHVNQLNEINQQ